MHLLDNNNNRKNITTIKIYNEVIMEGKSSDNDEIPV